MQVKHYFPSIGMSTDDTAVYTNKYSVYFYGIPNPMRQTSI